LEWILKIIKVSELTSRFPGVWSRRKRSVLSDITEATIKTIRGGGSRWDEEGQKREEISARQVTRALGRIISMGSGGGGGE